MFYLDILYDWSLSAAVPAASPCFRLSPDAAHRSPSGERAARMFIKTGLPNGTAWEPRGRIYSSSRSSQVTSAIASIT
jgi:hypothetical protein